MAVNVFKPCSIKASVVVAALPDSIDSFAYGDDVAPIPTRSVVVDTVTLLGSEKVHPPADELPPDATTPHDTMPLESVCNAEPPTQEPMAESVTPFCALNTPATCRVPDAFSAPPTCNPAPIEEDALEMNPPKSVEISDTYSVELMELDALEINPPCRRERFATDNELDADRGPDTFKLAPMDEDAAADAAWKDFQERQSAAS